MPTPDYLQVTKNGWYRYRRNLPADIRKQFKKPVFIKCLHTRDKEEAKCKSHAISVEFNALVKRTRGALAKRCATFLRTADIEQVAGRFETLLLHSDEQARKSKLNAQELAEHKALIQEGAMQTAEALYAQDPENYHDDYLSFADTEGLRINPSWSHFERFALAMLGAQARAYQALEARIKGQLTPTPVVPACVRSDEDMDDLEKLVAYWKKQQQIKLKTGIEIDSVVGRLRSFANIRRVSQIDDELPARFRDYLLEHGNLQRVKPGQPGTPLSVATAKKLIRLLSAAIQFAVNDKKLPKNPLAGVKFPKEKNSIKGKRFEVTHLNQIFASPVYTQHYRPAGGAGEAAFWLPLFGLFAGGRETELGQPLLTDIGCEEGMYFIEVTDEGEGQSVKNDESKRRIPLHSKLIDIGLLEYITWLKEKGETKLFPELRPDCHGALLGNWSKWFNRYLDDVVGIDARGLNYHSFRHSLKYFGRDSGIADVTLDRLQGHKPANVGEKYGGHYPLRPLANSLQMLSVPGLDIGHIRWSRPTGQESKRLGRAAMGTVR